MFFAAFDVGLVVHAEVIHSLIRHPKFTCQLGTKQISFDFQLLQKDATKRLGSGKMGSEEIKRHKWFKPINWKKLEARQIQPSFRPEVAGKQCVANFEKHWTDMPVVDSPVASPNAFGNNPFTGFSYVRPPASFLQMDGSIS